MKVPAGVRPLFILAVLLASLASAAAAQNCGFPWTVTATPAGGKSVAIQIRGFYAGCHPHNPQFTVQGSEIHVTLQSSVPPDRCMCLAVEGTFQESVLVHPIEPGAYTVTTTLLSCDTPLETGSTRFVFDATSAIPALETPGLAALGLLPIGVALWRLRA